nr:hypothetical protein [uncultured Actinoplanes sp.]
MDATKIALIIATVASPVVAIVSSIIGYKTAVYATRTARETAEASRALEREKLSAEMRRDQTNWYLQQRREAYLKVLTQLTGLGGHVLPQPDDPTALQRHEQAIYEALPTIKLFAPEEVIELTLEYINDVRQYRRLLAGGLHGLVAEAPYVLNDREKRLVELMRQTMGTNPEVLQAAPSTL